MKAEAVNGHEGKVQSRVQTCGCNACYRTPRDYTLTATVRAPLEVCDSCAGLG